MIFVFRLVEVEVEAREINFNTAVLPDSAEIGASRFTLGWCFTNWADNKALKFRCDSSKEYKSVQWEVTSPH